MDSYKTQERKVFKTRILHGLRFILTISLLFSWGLAFATTTDEELENQVRAISHQLRCPTCQAMSVKESEAGLSTNMKNKIREMLQEGKSEAEIMTFFVERYGEWILRSPKKEGFNLILWLAPLILIIIVGLIVIRTLLKRSRAAEHKQQSPLSASEKRLLEKDLDRFQAD